jgi:acyl carrier protein
MTNAAEVIRDYIHRELLADQQDTAFEDDEDLFEAGIIDSLGIFLLIEFLQKEFVIEIQPEDVVMKSFSTINGISGLVMEKRMKGSVGVS